METNEIEKVTYYEQPITLMRQNDKGKHGRKMKATPNWTSIAPVMNEEAWTWHPGWAERLSFNFWCEIKREINITSPLLVHQWWRPFLLVLAWQDVTSVHTYLYTTRRKKTEKYLQNCFLTGGCLFDLNFLLNAGLLLCLWVCLAKYVSVERWVKGQKSSRCPYA